MIDSGAAPLSVAIKFRLKTVGSDAHRLDVRLGGFESETYILAVMGNIRNQEGHARATTVKVRPLLFGEGQYQAGFDPQIMEQLTFGVFEDPLLRSIMTPVIAAHADGFLSAMTKALTAIVEANGEKGFGSPEAHETIKAICDQWSTELTL